MGLNAIQKTLSMLMILLLCALGVAEIGVRFFGESTVLQAQNGSSGACQQLLTNGDLEGSGGWQFGPTPARAALVENPVHAGAGAIRMGLVDTASNVVAHSSAYQSVTLPANATQLRLTFWERSGTGSDGADYREVLILRTNFSTLRTLSKETAAGNNNWTERTFDLTDLAGQTVYLYFNVYNNGAGARMVNYVDDVLLATCTDAATATPIPQVTATSTTSAAPTQTPTPAPSTTPLPTATPLADAVLVRVGSADAAGLSEVEVPLALAAIPAGENVGAISIDLLYDAVRLTVASCTEGGTFDLLLCNVDEAGRIQLAALAANGVASPATFANLRFTINGAQQEAIALELRTDSVINAQGADLPASTQNGQIGFNCDPNEEPCGGNSSTPKSSVYLPIMRR